MSAGPPHYIGQHILVNSRCKKLYRITILSDAYDAVVVLVDHGAGESHCLYLTRNYCPNADLFVRDKAGYARGRMAHHKAASQRNFRVLELLLQRNSRLSVERDYDGMTHSEILSRDRTSSDEQHSKWPRYIEKTETVTRLNQVPKKSAAAFSCPLCGQSSYSGSVQTCCKKLVCELCKSKRTTTCCTDTKESSRA